MMKLSQKAKNLKILAPAGDWECLRTAINAKADSVYFGIANFNMRSTGAKNFKLEDLPRIAKLCQKNNIETYLTINTIVYDNDLQKMKKIIKSAKENNCTGVIVSDFAAIAYAKTIKMPVCISTQMSISNIEAVRFFAKYSHRIILARELTLKQVASIVKKIKEENITGPNGKLVEIEIFGHGALCVAVSGRCNMSLYCYDSSANRGECTQVCRRSYKVTDVETGHELKIDNNYIMSPKDLCTLGLLPEIIDSGVQVLKLEGRGRSPEYVDIVVRVYKEAIEAIVDERFDENLKKRLYKKLESVFNRGLSTGLYRGRTFDEWAQGPGNQATEKREYVGKVLHYFPQKKVALIKVETKINLKEGVDCFIIGCNTGLIRFKLKNMIIDEKKVVNVKQKEEFTIQIKQRVRKNDQFYINKKT